MWRCGLKYSTIHAKEVRRLRCEKHTRQKVGQMGFMGFVVGDLIGFRYDRVADIVLIMALNKQMGEN